MTDTRCVNLPSVFHLKNTSLCSDVFGKHPRSSSLAPPPSPPTEGADKVRHHLRATSCCCPSEGDTSARGCTAAPAARTGRRPRWGRPPRSRCTTPTRRARGGEEPCGRWPGRPWRTGGTPSDREAPWYLWRSYAGGCYVKRGTDLFLKMPLLTWQNKAEGRWLEEEDDLFTERHGDANGPHHHQEQAEQGQHGCRYIQICTQEEDIINSVGTPLY